MAIYAVRLFQFRLPHSLWLTECEFKADNPEDLKKLNLFQLYHFRGNENMIWLCNGILLSNCINVGYKYLILEYSIFSRIE